MKSLIILTGLSTMMNSKIRLPSKKIERTSKVKRSSQSDKWLTILALLQNELEQESDYYQVYDGVDDDDDYDEQIYDYIGDDDESKALDVSFISLTKHNVS